LKISAFDTVAVDHDPDWENGPNWQTDFQTLVTNFFEPFLTFLSIPMAANDFGSLE